MLLPVFGLWGRLELSLAKARIQSVQYSDAIKRLDDQVDALKASHMEQAVQPGRIKEAIRNLGRQIEGLAQNMQKRK